MLLRVSYIFTTASRLQDAVSGLAEQVGVAQDYKSAGNMQLSTMLGPCVFEAQDLCCGTVWQAVGAGFGYMSRSAYGSSYIIAVKSTHHHHQLIIQA